MTTLILAFGALAALCFIAFILAAIRLERESQERERELDAYRASRKYQGVKEGR